MGGVGKERGGDVAEGVFGGGRVRGGGSVESRVWMGDAI